MSERTDISSILSPLSLLAALALAGCTSSEARVAGDAAPMNAEIEAAANEAAAAAQQAANEISAAANEAAAAARAAADEAVAAALAEEFPEVARNCGIPAATLTRDGEDYRLNLPPDVYAAPENTPAHGRILCITHWGLERGLDFIITEAR